MQSKAKPLSTATSSTITCRNLRESSTKPTQSDWSSFSELKVFPSCRGVVEGCRCCLEANTISLQFIIYNGSMPFNNCQQCHRLFHFLDPTRPIESEGNWPGDLESLCPECRRINVDAKPSSKETEKSLGETQPDDAKLPDCSE